MKIFKSSIILSFGYLIYKGTNKINFLELPDNSFMLRGNYENKIRQESTIEKIFEIFSSNKRDLQLFLSYADLIKSIIPFNFTEIENKKLDLIINSINDKYKKPFYSLFDIDKSGDIDVVEYLFFNIIHRINLNEISKDKSFNKIEFKEFLRKVQKKENLYLVKSFILDPRVNKISKEDIKNSEDKIINEIFKNKENIDFSEFSNLKNNISEQIYYSEFWMLMSNEELENKKEFITKNDFCKNIISFIHPNKVNNYFKIVDKINIDEKFYFEDFLNFKKFINSPLIEEYFKENGVITKKNFFKLNNQFCNLNGIKVNESTNRLVFELIDLDNSKYIDKKEYMSTIYRIRSLGRVDNKKKEESKMKPLLGLMNSYNIILDKIFKIYEIIIE